MKALKELAEKVVASMDWSVEDRLALLSGYVIGFDLRMEALEKRVYKLEDVVNEILRRTKGWGSLQQTDVHKGDGGAPERLEDGIIPVRLREGDRGAD